MREVPAGFSTQQPSSDNEAAARSGGLVAFLFRGYFAGSTSAP